jgi:hypothetical protein
MAATFIVVTKMQLSLFYTSIVLAAANPAPEMQLGHDSKPIKYRRQG